MDWVGLHDGSLNDLKHENSPCVPFLKALSYYLPSKGDWAAGWKTAGDESYAPWGPACPLQRPVSRAEADGA